MPLDNSAEYANHIPDAVRRQSERADEIARAAGVTNVPETEPVADPPAADPPAATTTVVPEPVATPTPAPAVDEWEQRYRTLQGKYDSEVAPLRAQVQGLERVIATMSSEPRPAATPTPAPAATTVVIPDKDKEEFGEDLIAAARRWARAEVSEEIRGLRSDLDAIKGDVSKTASAQHDTVVMTGRQSVMAALDRDPELGAAAPNGARATDGATNQWRVINDNPQFITWLQQDDPFSGQNRLRLLREAFDAGNAPRMKTIFKAFMTEHTVTQSAPPPQPTHTPAPGTDGPTLESLAAPGRASGSPPVGAPTDKRVWTHPDITAFYRDVQRGKYAQDPVARQRIENDIFAAQSEGRIR